MTLRYMLDTNVVSNVLRYPMGAAARRFRAFDKGELCISIVVELELQFWAAKLASRRLTEQIETASRLYSVLPLDRGVTLPYADIRAALERAGHLSAPSIH